MRVVATLSGLLFLATLPTAISPWGSVSLNNTVGVHDLNLHRWSAALAGGPDIGGAFILFYVAWRPLRAQAVMQWLALIVVVLLATNVPFVGPGVAVLAIPIVLILALYPEPRMLLEAPWSRGASIPLLVIGVPVAIFLLVGGAEALAAQIRGSGDLAANYDWASNAEHLVELSLAVLMASINKPGARVLGLMVGAVVAFLGTAAITVPNNPGSWGTLGGALAIGFGVTLAALAAYTGTRPSKDQSVA